MTAKIQFVPREFAFCHAGAKAPRDAVTIAERLGFSRLSVRRSVPPVAALSLLYFIHWLVRFSWRCLCIPQGALVFAQCSHVSVQERVSLGLLGWLRKRRSLRVVTLVHDVDALRGKGMGDCRNAIDSFLRRFVDASDVLIVHNAAMRKWFEEQGVHPARLVELGLFDYLSPVAAEKTRALSEEIVIAGCLAPYKAKYLTQLKTLSGLNWNLFGPDYDESAVGGSNVTYCGCHAPEELPRFLKGSFGLVWDGESVDTCSGPFGEYLRYNNPHKCSLYLAAGLPVIVWSESALAEFVRANNLGLCVNSLREIHEAISALNTGAYEQMFRNVKAVSAKLLAGQFLEAAIREAMSRHVPGRFA